MLHLEEKVPNWRSGFRGDSKTPLCHHLVKSNDGHTVIDCERAVTQRHPNRRKEESHASCLATHFRISRDGGVLITEHPGQDGEKRKDPERDKPKQVAGSHTGSEIERDTAAIATSCLARSWPNESRRKFSIKGGDFFVYHDGVALLDPEMPADAIEEFGTASGRGATSMGGRDFAGIREKSKGKEDDRKADWVRCAD